MKMSISTVEVEVVLLKKSNINSAKLEPCLESWLRKSEYRVNGVPIKDFEEVKELSDNIDHVIFWDDSRSNTHLPSVKIRYR